MLCCIAELVIFGVGIYVLATGKLTLSKNKIVTGGPARLCGVLLLLPFILGAGGEVVYGFVLGTQEAMKAPGQQPDIKAMQEKVFVPALIIHAIGAGIPLILTAIIAVSNGRPPEPKRPLEDDFRRGGDYRRDDDYRRGEEDEPRRGSEPPDDRFRAE